MRPLGQEDAILERARFAFVGIADDEALFGLAAMGETPFAASHETGATATTQTALLDGRDDLGRCHADSLLEAGIHRDRSEQHGAGVADIGVHHAVRPLARRGRSKARHRDLFRRFTRLERQRHVSRLLRGELGDHDIVDHGRRGLVAHADAGRVFKREGAVARGLSDLDAKGGLELAHDGIKTGKAIDDVVAKADGDPAFGCQREEAVEARHAFDLDP